MPVQGSRVVVQGRGQPFWRVHRATSYISSLEYIESRTVQILNPYLYANDKDNSTCRAFLLLLLLKYDIGGSGEVQELPFVS